MNHLTELVISCGSWQEAQRIADALLEKQLVSSIETFEIRPRHWWEGHGHAVIEVKILATAAPQNFTSIQALADKLRHANTAPVLLTELTN